MTGLIILVIIIVIALLFLTSCIKIVPQAKALVIERLGAYQATWSVGLHFKLPITNDVTKGGRRQILDCHDRVRYSVAEHLLICNLVEYNGIDPHGYIILCDNRLRCKINYLLF